MTFLRRLLVYVLWPVFLAAQTQPITTTHTQQLFYSGSNLQYVCDAPISVPATTVSRSAATLTNIVVAANVGTVTTATAHNLWVGARVAVSGSATSALNATYTVLTIPSSTTYTIATSGVSDATYTTGLVKIGRAHV